MTTPKSIQFKAKVGRKPKRLKKQQDKLLKMFFDAGDVPPWQASSNGNLMKCFSKSIIS